MRNYDSNRARKVARTYKLSEYTVTQIEALAAQRGESHAGIITIAIDRMAEREHTMKTTFDTLDDALEAGFTPAHAGGPVKDTSGPNEFGYAFTNTLTGEEAVNVWLRKERNKGGTLGAIKMMFPPTQPEK